jgi:hypothetical protein
LFQRFFWFGKLYELIHFITQIWFPIWNHLNVVIKSYKYTFKEDLRFIWCFKSFLFETLIFFGLVKYMN